MKNKQERKINRQRERKNDIILSKQERTRMKERKK